MSKLLKHISAVLVTGSILLSAGGAGAQGPAVDPARLALAQRYFDDIQLSKVMNQTFTAIMPALNAQLAKQYGDKLNNPQAAALSSATAETMAEMVTDMDGRMEAVMIPIVAQVFTTQELTDLVAFYDSPSGKAMVAKTPQLSAALAGHMAELMPDPNAITAKIIEKFCTKTDCNALPKAAPAKLGT